MKKQLTTIFSAALLLSACAGGPSATQGVTKAAEQTGTFGIGKKDVVSVATPKAFEGVKEVIIGGFTVGFATKSTDSVKAGGGLLGNGFGGKSTAKSSLQGISDADMQAITDKAYKNFVAELKAQGITVADRAPLLDSEDFKKTKTYPNPFEDKQGGLLGGGSVTKYFAPSEFGNLRIFAGDIPGEMGGFAFSSPSAGAALFADKAGKKVIHAVYLVDFANAESYGGWHTQSSAISVGQGVTVVPQYTKLNLIGGQSGTFSTNNGSITLGQPVSSMKEFATVSDSTGDAAKAVEIATNVIGVLGGIGSNSSRHYDFVARPDDYQAAVTEALDEANEALAKKMAGLR